MINVVEYKGEDKFNYMLMYNPNTINIFVGGRATGKSYSIQQYCEMFEKEINEIEVLSDTNIVFKRTYKHKQDIRGKHTEALIVKSGDVICMTPKQYNHFIIKSNE